MTPQEIQDRRAARGMNDPLNRLRAYGGSQPAITEITYRSEFTPAGEQSVIPGCEQDAPQTGTKQLNLF